MKQFIFAVFLLFFSAVGISSTVPTIPENPIIEIPLGVQIHKSMAIMFTICGKPFAMTIHTPNGTKVYQGKEMEQKIDEINAKNNNAGVPVVKTDLSDAWDDTITCVGGTPEETKPGNDHDFIEDMNRGKGPFWSARYQQ